MDLCISLFVASRETDLSALEIEDIQRSKDLHSTEYCLPWAPDLHDLLPLLYRLLGVLLWWQPFWKLSGTVVDAHHLGLAAVVECCSCWRNHGLRRNNILRELSLQVRNRGIDDHRSIHAISGWWQYDNPESKAMKAKEDGRWARRFLWPMLVRMDTIVSVIG